MKKQKPPGSPIFPIGVLLTLVGLILIAAAVIIRLETPTGPVYVFVSHAKADTSNDCFPMMDKDGVHTFCGKKN